MKPLQDIRIVSLEQYGAGPFGTLHLADLGAEVIKVEDPAAGGDVGRTSRPTQRVATRCSSRRSTATSARRPRPRDARWPGGLRGPRPGLGRRLLELARRRAGEAPDPLRRPVPPQRADRVLLAVGLRHDRATRCRTRLRLRLAGARRLDGPHRRARRPAGQERALSRRLLGRSRRSDQPARRGPRGRGATGAAWTATSASTTPPSGC